MAHVTFHGLKSLKVRKRFSTSKLTSPKTDAQTGSVKSGTAYDVSGQVPVNFESQFAELAHQIGHLARQFRR